MAAAPKTLPPGSMPSSDGSMIFSGRRSGYHAVQGLTTNFRTIPGAKEAQVVNDVTLPNNPLQPPRAAQANRKRARQGSGPRG